MSHNLVGFSHDSGDWISVVMAWVTFGQASHMVMISPCGQWFIEATGVKTPQGVQPPRPIYEFINREGAVIRKIEHPNPEGVWAAALTQVGKGYDWLWFVGWLFRSRNWQDLAKWVCAELYGWCERQAGYSNIDGDHNWHLTPNDWRMISKPL